MTRKHTLSLNHETSATEQTDEQKKATLIAIPQCNAGLYRIIYHRMPD